MLWNLEMSQSFKIIVFTVTVRFYFALHFLFILQYSHFNVCKFTHTLKGSKRNSTKLHLLYMKQSVTMTLYFFYCPWYQAQQKYVNTLRD